MATTAPKSSGKSLPWRPAQVFDLSARNSPPQLNSTFRPYSDPDLGLVHRDSEWQPYRDGWVEWLRSFGWRRLGW